MEAREQQVFLDMARRVLDEAVRDMEAAIDGAAPEMLNRRPAGEDTNSIAVLAVHSLSSTRWKLSVATGAPLPYRKRDDEFLTMITDATSLLRVVQELHGDCARMLETRDAIDWETRRALPYTPGPGDLSDQPAHSLLYGMAHLREHVGQMLLTRQLFDGTNDGPR